MKTKFLFLILTLVATLFLTAKSVLAAASFQEGDFFRVYNNTKQDTPSWVDPLNNADVRNIVEYQIRVTNQGADIAQNVGIFVGLPDYCGNREVATVHLTADNASEVTDIATVNVTTPGRINYLPGHARYVDSTGEHSLPDTITTSGVSLASINSGNAATVQVLFKAVIDSCPTPTPTVTPTPTPTPTPSSTPTSTPTNTPSVTPTPTPTNSPTPTGTPPVLGATNPPVLPETGSSDYLILLAAPALIGVGVYIYKKFRLI